MSRPYLKINTASFNSTTNVVTLDVLALRVRGGSDITLTGLTQSTKTIALTDGYFSGSVTYSAALDTSTSSNATTVAYSNSSVVLSFTGPSASITSNVKLNLGSGLGNLLGTGGYTFSATQSSASASQTIFSQLTNLPTGFTASISSSTITVSAPWGVYYNGLDALLTVVPGAYAFTASFASGSGTFSEFANGTTNYTLKLNAPSYFGFSEDTSFDLLVGSYSTGFSI